ncbi:MAG: DUF4388 domain-containing protein [Gemmatimonadota bacterium]|nr:DUF4388 domain-containing protein [Gemmatimonadota bacterium]
MAIEGPLRELGIHDVFQLLDLSRKTGVLRVVSELRDNEGVVAFHAGRIAYASIRSNPHPIGEMLLKANKIAESDLNAARTRQTEHGDRRRIGEILIDMGAVTARDVEQYVRRQAEAVVFELMSWREGHFRFEESNPSEFPENPSVAVSTESVLMEAARRIDEWSRIADRVPSLSAIPDFADVADGHHAGQLDLLPSEWEVLTLIDGQRDLRRIALELARSDFDVAKVVYGLVSTGVVALRAPDRRSRAVEFTADEDAERQAAARALVLQGLASVRGGRLEDALRVWKQYLEAYPADKDAPAVRDGLSAAERLQRATEVLRGE